MHLGIAKIKITPVSKVRLSGYATRESVFDQVLEDLYLRVHYFRDMEQNTDLIFIYADLLWWGSDFHDSMKEILENKFKVPFGNIIFVASHNHSGPATSDNFTKTLETFNENYANYLRKRVVLAVEVALGNLEEITGRLYRGFSDLNVYRRVNTKDGIKMMPNYSIEPERDLTIIEFLRTNQTRKGIMIHYPCHANISNENSVQPDYPGIALRLIDDDSENAVSLFMQGCTADLRPNVVLGNKFIPQGYENVITFARYFVEDIKNTLDHEFVPLQFHLAVTHSELPLKMNNLKTAKEIAEMSESGTIVEKEWAEKILDKGNRDFEILKMSKVNFAKEINFITYNCELSQDYSLYAKSIDKSMLSVTYANGMIGYVCTEKQINEGGYEPIDSGLYFALSGNYKPESEKIIHERLIKMIRE